MLVSTFNLGKLYLGIDIILVREISPSMDYMPIPGAPDYLRGMLNIRGRVITLFDLEKRLGWARTPPKSNKGTNKGVRKQFNVIMKTHAEVACIDREIADTQCVWEDPVGLVVDRLGDVREIPDDNIMPAPANLKGISVDFVHGVVGFEQDLLIILKVASVFGFNRSGSE